METKEEYKVQKAIDEINEAGMAVDLSVLARDLLHWEDMRRELDFLEAGIKDAVLHLGKTQTAGYGRATYNNPRNSYDYEKAACMSDLDKEAFDKLVEAHKKVSVDWRALCKAAKIEPIVTPGTGPGSVTLRLLKP